MLDESSWEVADLGTQRGKWRKAQIGAAASKKQQKKEAGVHVRGACSVASPRVEFCLAQRDCICAPGEQTQRRTARDPDVGKRQRNASVVVESRGRQARGQAAWHSRVEVCAPTARRVGKKEVGWRARATPFARRSTKYLETKKKGRKSDQEDLGADRKPFESRCPLSVPGAFPHGESPEKKVKFRDVSPLFTRRFSRRLLRFNGKF
ncbi:hypothetical protein TGARI_294680 [Toxoplasma gondii ARI]|uniref:Uncharacterized protein n=1 Tax=Toxoplasma gondii ARI TaxID=1074872 RepID=A0A139XLP5_TOXGO|nr:hypothetical protein TGARI_294680 [Toxoplasma gondii ARI]